MRPILFLVVILLACTGMKAQATTINYRFTGVVNSICESDTDGNITCPNSSAMGGPEISVGDSFSGFLRYHTNAVVAGTDPDFYTWYFDEKGSIEMHNERGDVNIAGVGMDFFVWDDPAFPGVPLSDALRIIVVDNSLATLLQLYFPGDANMLSSKALPDQLDFLANPPYGYFGITRGRDPGNPNALYAQGYFTGFERVQDVPEPGSFALCLGALLALSAVHRRKRPQ